MLVGRASPDANPPHLMPNLPGGRWFNSKAAATLATATILELNSRNCNFITVNAIIAGASAMILQEGSRTRDRFVTRRPDHYQHGEDRGESAERPAEHRAEDGAGQGEVAAQCRDPRPDRPDRRPAPRGRGGVP